MKKNNIWISLLYGIYLCIIYFVLVLALLIDKRVLYGYKNASLFSNAELLLFFFGVGHLCLKSGIVKCFLKLNVKKMLLTGNIILLITQFFVVYSIYFVPGWDAGVIGSVSASLARGGVIHI